MHYEWSCLTVVEKRGAVKRECARAEGVGSGERKARTAKQPQGPAREPQPSEFTRQGCREPAWHSPLWRRLWDRLSVSCRQQHVKSWFPCVEVRPKPRRRRGGGLEETSSSSKIKRIVQRDANGWREANVILRSGNAPKRSGGQVPKARRSRPQGPAREPC